MSSQLPSAEIVHAIAGRTRLRIAAQRGDNAFFASVATGLSSLQGVERVDVRPLTGSILVHHRTPLAELADAAARARLFAIGSAEPNREHDHTPALDARMMLAAAFGAFALWQLVQGRILPPALTLLLNAAALAGLTRVAPED